MTYELHQTIKDNSRLAKIFNSILSKCNLQRIISCPRTFEDMKSEYLAENMYLFYIGTLHELWMHKTVSRLKEWREKINEYLSDYNGSHVYYACCKRLEYIKEWGGEKYDYDENGEIKTEGIDKELMQPYTIVSELKEYGRDIVTETVPEDLQGLATALDIHAKSDISEIFRNDAIHPYRMQTDEYGETIMVEMSREDMELMKIARSVNATDMLLAAKNVCSCVNEIYNDILELDPEEDNKERLTHICYNISALLDYRLEDIKPSE